MAYKKKSRIPSFGDSIVNFMFEEKLARQKAAEFHKMYEAAIKEAERYLAEESNVKNVFPTKSLVESLANEMLYKEGMRFSVENFCEKEDTFIIKTEALGNLVIEVGISDHEPVFLVLTHDNDKLLKMAKSVSDKVIAK